jgi:death-on-curing protein
MKEPVWIEEYETLLLHDRLLALHGGASGVRDQALLESALHRPRHRFAYANADIVEMAASYTAALAKNHAFVDGNQRTAFVVGVLFLELNGYSFTATEEAAAQAVIALAAGQLDEAGYTAFLRDHAKPA